MVMAETPAQSTPSPEDSVGLILQRGGEELSLKKAIDRITVCFRGDNTDIPTQTGAIAQRRITSASFGYHIEEFLVDPNDLDEVMTTLRREDNIAFVSHVYEVLDNPETYIYLTQQLTIQFAPNLTSAQEKALADLFGLELERSVEGLANTYIYNVSPASKENPIKLANRLMEHSEILACEPNIMLTKENYYRPKDEFYKEQWYLHNDGGTGFAPNSHINVERAWDFTLGSRDVIIAIADDGIDVRHPDFQGEGKIVFPVDFKSKDFDPTPDNPQECHGTACASIAVAEENGTGIVGVAPKCALMPMRTTGLLDDQSVEEIFDWAIQHNASVICCSWSASAVRFPLSLRQNAAITRAAKQGRNGKGCVIVFAAGNANRPINGVVYERNWPNNLLTGPTQWLNGFTIHPDVIAVSACTSLNTKAVYSNWGVNISVCAPSSNGAPTMWFDKTGFTQTAPQVNTPFPGHGIFAADTMGEFGYDKSDFTRDFGGTSAAAPVIAGVAALMISVNPELTALEIKQILQQTADKITDPSVDPQLGLQLGTYDQNGHSQWFGYGKVNAGKAVENAFDRLKNKDEGIIIDQNTTPFSIPDDDGRGVYSTIEIEESGQIESIDVTVDIEHEFLGDIEISLGTPSDQLILLQSRVLGTQTVLKYTYNCQNTPALRQVLDQDCKGTWLLWVVDYAPEDKGKLKSWSLRLDV